MSHLNLLSSVNVAATYTAMPVRSNGAKKKLLTKQKLDKHVAALRAFVKEHKNKRAPRVASSGKLRVFSDCAGISSELIALRLLGLTSEHIDFVGGSEVDPTKRCLMQCVHRECQMATNGDAVEKDLFHRSLEATQPCDLYVAGFPCPAYSALGKKKGAQDGQGRGLLVFEGLKYIARWKPSVVVLENVGGFLHKRHESTHKVMKKALAALNYKVYVKILNSKQHGVPHSRSRVYFVAFRSSKDHVRFRFPKPLPKCSKLVHFLDAAEKGNEKLDLPSFEEKYGRGFWTENVVLDIGSSVKWQSKTRDDVCPCLTRGRCLQKGYYLPKQLRRLTGVECARLQGVPSQVYGAMVDFMQRKSKHSTAEAAEKQVMGALGDSMSINVLMRLLPLALSAVSLWPKTVKMKDPWSKVSPGKDAAEMVDKLWA